MNQKKAKQLRKLLGASGKSNMRKLKKEYATFSTPQKEQTGKDLRNMIGDLDKMVEVAKIEGK